MRTSVEWPQYALQAGKGSVAFQSSRENRSFGFLRTGASGDGGMGLFAQFDPLAVRGLVLLQFCSVMFWRRVAAQKIPQMTKLSALKILMLSQLTNYIVAGGAANGRVQCFLSLFYP